VPVVLPLSTNITPPGRVPLSVSAGVGKPVEVTVKVPTIPSPNVVLLGLVITGSASIIWVRADDVLAPKLVSLL